MIRLEFVPEGTCRSCRGTTMFFTGDDQGRPIYTKCQMCDGTGWQTSHVVHHVDSFEEFEDLLDGAIRDVARRPLQ